MQTMTEKQRAFLPGTVDLVILRTLSEGPGHGFAISRTIRARSGGVLELQDAALYQALHRMESKGWIAAEWGVSENNRRAKFYQLTSLGRKQLDSEASSWREYATAIFRILEPAGAGEG
jgi:PadR family transcriptional regulator PadR